MQSNGLTKLLMLWLACLTLTACSTSPSAACITYQRYARGTNDGDTAETIDGFAVLDAAMIEACAAR